MPLNKTGTPTGNYTFAIRDSSETIKGSATGVANNLTTSYVITEVTLNTPVLIEVGDHVTIEYDNTSPATGKLSFPTSSSGWVANTDQQNWISSAWQGDGDGAGAGRKWQFTFDSTPTIGGLSNQRFVENFSGGSLDTDRWQQNNRSGTGTFAMANDIDGGFSVTCSSNAGSASVIDFNNIRPFAHNGSVMIAVGKRITSGGYDKYGLCNLVSYGSTASQVYASDNSNNTYKNLVTGSGSSASSTLSDVAIDTNFTGYKIELSTDAKMTINGVLKVTHTTTLPTARLQPHIGAENNGATAIEMRVRYAEVYNT